MAEFTSVMRQYRRMCLFYRKSKNRCDQCPLNSKTRKASCIGLLKESPSEFEEKVSTWAKLRGPIYPSWREWYESITDAKKAETFKPCVFASRGIFNCDRNSCHRCRNDEIPAYIAKKFGIQPLSEGM